MHITLETDYAIRIVDYLARTEGRVGAQAIAAQNDVTLRFSLKILRKLVSSGIVRSYKGSQGGYEIAKPLNEISMGDILKTIEGDYALSRCLKDGAKCTREDCCPYHKLYDEISTDVRQKLNAAKMDEMIKRWDEHPAD